MAMMIAVLVVIAEHPPVIGSAYARINVSESVFRHLTVLQPDLALQIAAATLARETRNFLGVLHVRLRLPLIPWHQNDLSRIDIKCLCCGSRGRWVCLVFFLEAPHKPCGVCRMPSPGLPVRPKTPSASSKSAKSPGRSSLRRNDAKGEPRTARPSVLLSQTSNYLSH
jgi:hypothetical protein